MWCRGMPIIVSTEKVKVRGQWLINADRSKFKLDQNSYNVSAH